MIWVANPPQREGSDPIRCNPPQKLKTAIIPLVQPTKGGEGLGEQKKTDLRTRCANACNRRKTDGKSILTLLPSPAKKRERGKLNQVRDDTLSTKETEPGLGSITVYSALGLGKGAVDDSVLSLTHDQKPRAKGIEKRRKIKGWKPPEVGGFKPNLLPLKNRD